MIPGLTLPGIVCSFCGDCSVPPLGSGLIGLAILNQFGRRPMTVS